MAMDAFVELAVVFDAISAVAHMTNDLALQGSTDGLVVGSVPCRCSQSASFTV